MSVMLIAGGHVVDPSQGLDRVCDVRVVDGRIAGFPDAGSPTGPVDETIDARGRIVAPGLVDLNTRLGEPGYEEDETIRTGTAAALAGGYTTIACCPLTNPPMDTEAGVEFVLHKAARANSARVVALACVSKHGEGKELAEIGSLVGAGAVGFTDGERPLQNSELLRRALEYCLMFDRPILSHPEVPELSRGGVMHEGTTSTILGLAGMPSESEDVMTGRDIRLCESTRGRLHLLHVSTAGSVDLVRRAKTRGVRVTCGIPITNLCFVDEALRSFDPNYKLNPPLRSRGHVDACLAGLTDGTIDAILSGHTPRAAEKKSQEIDLSPFGAIGLETALPLAIEHLIDRGRVGWSRLIELMSTNPSRVLGLSSGTLAIGAEADLIVIDPDARWTVGETTIRSKSANTPLWGKALKGRVVRTLVAGR